MTLEDLRKYHVLREYQISHLINAKKCHRYINRNDGYQMYIFLFYWADAMYEADQLQMKCAKSNVLRQSRGKA